MKNLLIFTTIKDLSIPLFLTNYIKSRINIDFCLYSEDQQATEQQLKSKKYDYIYLRDPFTGTLSHQDIRRKINFILSHQEGAYLIDNIQSAADIFLEDKWKQYQMFPRFMPQTELFKGGKKYGDNTIFKKRISSRAKGIRFSPKGIQGDYIAQEKLEIKKEYRVYVIFGQILEMAAIKNKKIIGQEKISSRLQHLVKDIIQRVNFDFIDLDIAETKNNELFLLEINRSCLFNGYFRVTQINLAEVFIDKLIENC